MGLEVINFLKDTTTGAHTQDVTHNLGETPKLIILMGMHQLSPPIFGAHQHAWFGFHDGTNDYVQSWAANNNQANVLARSALDNTKCIKFMDWNGTVQAEANISAWDSTKFTINWTTALVSNQYVMTAFVVSGSGVSAKAINWTEPAATGNKAVTGIGFKPETLIHMGTNVSSFSISSANIYHFRGIVDQFGNEYSVATFMDMPNAASDCACALYDDVIHVINATSTIVRASHVSMDSDGFTNNFSAVNGAGTQIIVTLAIKGLASQIGIFDKSTSVSTPVSQQVTGLNIKPQGLFFMHTCQTAINAIKAGITHGLGWGDGATEWAHHYNDEDAADPTNCDGAVDDGKAILVADNYTPVIEAECDITALDNLAFTVQWTTNNAVATKIVYLALGERIVEDTVSVTDDVIINTGFVVISENITVTDALSLIHVIQETITLTETVTVARLISILESVGITDAVNVSSFINVNESISVTDALERVVTVQELITLMDAIYKSIKTNPSESVTVSDQVIVTKRASNTYEAGDETIIIPARQTVIMIDNPKKEN